MLLAAQVALLCPVGGLLAVVANRIRDNDKANAEKCLKQALEIREKVFGLKSRSTARSLARLGNIYKEHEDYKSAQPYFERALAAYEKIHGADHPVTQEVRQPLAEVLRMAE